MINRIRAMALVFGPIFLALCASCGQSEKTETSTAEVSPPPGKPVAERFCVERQGSFQAGYSNHVREILIITDKETGKEYLGITGVGVTEMWTETKRIGKMSRTETVEE